MSAGERRLRTGRWVLVASTAAMLFSGCAVARSAGGDLADGVVARLRADTALHALRREFADSMGEALRVEFESAVLAPARTTVSELGRSATQDVQRMEEDLGVWVRTDLNDAVRRALSDNATVLDERLPSMAEATAEALVTTLARDIINGLGPVGDTLVFRMLRATAVGLNSELGPAIHALMRDVRDSLQVRIQDVDQAVVGSRSFGWLRSALMGAGVAVVLAGLLIVFGQRRRQGLALHALIDAIDAVEDEGLRAKVRMFASEAGVHGWLTDRVAHRRTCRPEPLQDGGTDEAHRQS